MFKSSRIRLHWIWMLKAHYQEPNSLQTEKINEPNNIIPLRDLYENQIMRESRMNFRRTSGNIFLTISLPRPVQTASGRREGNVWAHKRVEEADFGLCGWQIEMSVGSLQWNRLCCRAAVQNIPKMGFSLSGKRQGVQILCNLEAA